MRVRVSVAVFLLRFFGLTSLNSCSALSLRRISLDPQSQDAGVPHASVRGRGHLLEGRIVRLVLPALGQGRGPSVMKADQQECDNRNAVDAFKKNAMKNPDEKTFLGRLLICLE